MRREPPPPIPENAPERFTRWRHIITYEQYFVCEIGYNEADLKVVVVYEHSKDHTVWVRPLENFLLRFVRDVP